MLAILVIGYLTYTLIKCFIWSMRAREAGNYNFVKLVGRVAFSICSAVGIEAFLIIVLKMGL